MIAIGVVFVADATVSVFCPEPAVAYRMIHDLHQPCTTAGVWSVSQTQLLGLAW